jgi:hypothetical protein
MQWVFPGVKRQRRGVDHPPTYKAEVNERAKLYLYLHFGPSWTVLGRTFSIYFKFLVKTALLLAWEVKLPIKNMFTVL